MPGAQGSSAPRRPAAIVPMRLRTATTRQPKQGRRSGLRAFRFTPSTKIASSRPQCRQVPLLVSGRSKGAPRPRLSGRERAGWSETDLRSSR